MIMGSLELQGGYSARLGKFPHAATFGLPTLISASRQNFEFIDLIECQAKAGAGVCDLPHGMIQLSHGKRPNMEHTPPTIRGRQVAICPRTDLSEMEVPEAALVSDFQQLAFADLMSI